MIAITALAYLLVDLSVCVSGQSFVWGRETKATPEGGIPSKRRVVSSKLAEYVTRNAVNGTSKPKDQQEAVPSTAAAEEPRDEESRAEAQPSP